MGEPNGGLLGKLAVHYKLISMQQLATASQFQGQYPNKPFGEILVGLGYMSAGQLAKLKSAESETLKRMEAQGTSPASVRPTPQKPEVGIPVPAASPAVPTPSAPASGGPGAISIGIDLPEDDEQLVLEPPTPGGEPLEHTIQLPPEARKTTSSQPVSSAPIGAHADEASLTYLHNLLRSAADAGASDVHVHAGSKVRMRRFTKLTDLTQSPVDKENSMKILASCLSDEEYKTFTENGEVDFALALPGVGRFRACVYRQHGGCDGVFHFIPQAPPTLKELGLPEEIGKLTDFHQGLVLVTGPAGCGKSSTLAALVNILNEDRSDHILTVEDPIEYIHPSKSSLVNQRQVKRHTESFARALRAALREDPDVICIGELRDLETISLALSAAETGHLVLGTLHTNNSIRTINRIIGAYPPSQQSQIRTMLSESLRAVLSQRLMPSVKGDGVVLGYELLLVNHAVSNLIRENRAFQIQSVLQTGAAQGMQMLDIGLRKLVTEGKISKEVAKSNADNPQAFG